MLDRLLSRNAQDELLQRVRPALGGGVVTSLRGSSAPTIAALLYRDAPRQTLLVTPKLDDAEGLSADLATLLPDQQVLHFPEFEILPYDKRSPYKGITGQQVEVLHKLLSGEPCLVVTSAKGIKWKVQPPEEILDYTLRFEVGASLDLEDTIRRFGEMGYYAVPRVEAPGDFARKGGILDVFSVSYENPVRVEFVGDEVESMRYFDATTQRSLEEIRLALVPPCSPLILSGTNIERAKHAVGATQHGEVRARERLRDHIAERLHFDGMERFAAFYSERRLLTDFFLDTWQMLWVCPDAVVEQLVRLEEEIQKLFADCLRAGEPVPEPARIYATSDEILALPARVPTTFLSDVHLGQHPLAKLEEHPAPPVDGEPDTTLRVQPTTVRLNIHAPESYGGRVPTLRRDLERRLREGQRVHVFCDNEGQAERLRELLDEIADQIDFPVGELQSGFILADYGIVVLTDREIFERYRKRQRRRKYRVGQALSSYEEFAQGDFVVHVNYGIARYLGIQKITVEGSEIDCLQLLYAGGDKIYVTVDQLNMVEKYVGKEGVEPVLSRLGTAAWERTKERAKRAIAEMAEELLQIAAIRRSRPGFAFSSDSHLLKELEASFIYDETPDQLTAIVDVKNDMQRPAPMDRLICGDVGYGKTEVAIRAAFKAVLDDKQVAVLVPTTLLAQQHVGTFRERLADYPVNIEMVSRLRSAREQRETLQKLARGEVDIIIGTHRLLSKDVRFKALGLMVIDEEHRFGVAHKEKLKHFKQTVDVLSMTATPIPRTLHMALIGLRDMSLINTAPRDRLPVQTEIVPFDDETITDAILRELDRGGQVYFVHNRVESIDAMAGYVKRLAPSARVAVAHGQMDEQLLERVMLEFIDQKHDVLVSTMIIESGLDIPSVNTLIVNRADTLGLAQLYQLRGRVGRSSHKAYAYLMVPRGGSTTDLARKRLAAMQEFEALGSGLRVAMRDLEIRGAGNILGAQQHGQLVAVGFELYCKLVEQTVAELQGQELPEEITTKVEVDVEYRIPDRYISDGEEKMRVYKRVAATTVPEEIRGIRDELVDRYGPLPEPATNLMHVSVLRLKAWHAGVERLRLRAGRADFAFRAGVVLKRPEIEAIVRATPNKLAFDVAGSFRLSQHLRPGDRFAQVEALLDHILESRRALASMQ